MLWEAHVTVADKNGDEVERWRSWCERVSVKPLYIELTTGEHRKQLMFAARWEGGTEFGRHWLNDLSGEVMSAGFEVLREKLECPLDKAYGLAGGENSYSECHMKLMLPASVAERVVAKVCGQANVHGSRNLLADQDGLQKWYLTQRDHDRTYVSDVYHSASMFNRALAQVQQVHPAVRMEMEFVFHDSNPRLDAGWAERDRGRR